MTKIILQLISVISISVATYLATKKSRWCWPLYQIGCIARVIMYVQVDLHIELLLQAYFTYMNVRGWRLWKQK